MFIKDRNVKQTGFHKKIFLKVTYIIFVSFSFIIIIRKGEIDYQISVLFFLNIPANLMEFSYII